MKEYQGTSFADSSGELESFLAVERINKMIKFYGILIEHTYREN